MPAAQSYANHRKFVPLYHFVALPIFTLNFVWAVHRAIDQQWSVDAIVNVLTAAALIVLTFFARIFALRVQDRVIRLEMRQRLADALPADLALRARALTMRQLISLRFASDAELPEIVDRVLRDNVTDGTAIKKMIVAWEADHHRA